MPSDIKNKDEKKKLIRRELLNKLLQAALGVGLMQMDEKARAFNKMMSRFGSKVAYQSGRGRPRVTKVFFCSRCPIYR